MLPDRLIQDKPVEQQIGYYQAEEVMAEQNRIAKHKTDLNVKLTIELRNYLLHLSIISATIIGVVSTLGREIIQGSVVGMLGFISLLVSLLGGVGLSLMRTSTSIRLNDEAYAKVSNGLDEQKEIMMAMMLGKKAMPVAMGELEELKKAAEPLLKAPKPLKEDWMVWGVFGTFFLGVILVFVRAFIVPPVPM